MDFPMEPTSAPPGSTQKIAVLRLRALAGEPLFHGDDQSVLTARQPNEREPRHRVHVNQRVIAAAKAELETRLANTRRSSPP